MELKLHIAPAAGNRSEKQIAAAVKALAGLWRDGRKEEAVAELNGIFNETVPDPELFRSYRREFGREFGDLVAKLYLLHADEADDDMAGALLAYEEAGENAGLVSRLAARLVGELWEEVRSRFYDHCPECMFMGGADEPFSLKIRSESCIECIPEDSADLHELSKPSSDYAHAMDGYSFYEGHALVRDDPEAQEELPPDIRAILRKIKARKLKYFPNVIYPLVQGEDLVDSCRQMLELLQLLDHGYHFEAVSRYITNHPAAFPDVVRKRLAMFEDDTEDGGLDPDDGDEEDDELTFDDFDFDDDDFDDEDEDCDGDQDKDIAELSAELDSLLPKKRKK